MISVVLFLALLATAMGQSVVMTILPSLGRQTGLSELQVASILSLSAFIFAFGSTWWSKRAQSLGYRTTLLIGLAGYSLGTLGFASVFALGQQQVLLGSWLFVSLLIARMAQSSVMSATPPSVVGYTTLYARQRDLPSIRFISRVTSANSLGQILGPGFAGLLVHLGLVAPLYAIIIMTLLALLLVWRKLPEQAITSYRIDSEMQSSSTLAFSARPLIAYAIIIFICMAMLQQSLGFLLIDYFHYTPVAAAQRAGAAMMNSALAALFVQWTVVQRGRLSAARSLLIAALLLIAGYGLITSAQSLMTIYIAMLCIGAGTGIGYPTITAALTSECPAEQRARMTGYITAAPALGYIIGPPLGAYLYTWHTHFPFYACTFFCIALVFLYNSNSMKDKI